MAAAAAAPLVTCLWKDSCVRLASPRMPLIYHNLSFFQHVDISYFMLSLLCLQHSIYTVDNCQYHKDDCYGSECHSTTISQH